MWIRRDVASLTLRGPTGLTIGAFDGVHIGHQALIRRMVTESHQADMQAVVLTFDPLPRQVLGHPKHGVLSTLEERLELLEALEPDGIVVQPFDHNVASIPAADFVTWLVEKLALAGLWVGPDFALGHNHEGNIPFLQAMGAHCGFAVHIFAENVPWGGYPVRSSRIRRALKDGDLVQANGCLGRPYRLSGVVEHGDERGRRLGFPTANLQLPGDPLLPANGVYICRAHLHAEHFDALVNVGTRPTFDSHSPMVEAHLLDFSRDIYAEPLKLDFLHRLREELRFPSAEALREQMYIDRANTLAWLKQKKELQDGVGAK
ncbi:MAG TPA: riboflavin biosynthesis protein RibF [Anaerolineae bacterium]|nr:riboflavin biosynthesis protein RibF [Anaerolineae bacterium]HQH37650.1 riboflavin biosynthesis protein RibF [Anaerolineae bacterium]